MKKKMKYPTSPPTRMKNKMMNPTNPPAIPMPLLLTIVKALNSFL